MDIHQTQRHGGAKAGLLSESSCLAAALGVTQNHNNQCYVLGHTLSSLLSLTNMLNKSTSELEQASEMGLSSKSG